jgi:hypothetical protein
MKFLIGDLSVMVLILQVSVATEEDETTDVDLNITEAQPTTSVVAVADEKLCRMMLSLCFCGIHRTAKKFEEETDRQRSGYCEEKGKKTRKRLLLRACPARVPKVSEAKKSNDAIAASKSDKEEKDCEEWKETWCESEDSN